MNYQFQSPMRYTYWFSFVTLIRLCVRYMLYLDTTLHISQR